MRRHPSPATWVFFVGAFVAASTMAMEARAERLPASPRVPTHLACVGDSITAGVGASSRDGSYPSVLQDLLGASGRAVAVRNFGRSGATSLRAGDVPYVDTHEHADATRFVAGAGPNALVDVVILLGTNDSKPWNWTPDGGVSAGSFIRDYAQLVDHFASLPTKPVVYIGIPPTALANTFGIDGAVLRDSIGPLLRAFARQRGLPVVDLATPTEGHPEYLPDGVHPNDAGYAVVARVVRDRVMAVPAVSIASPSDEASVVASGSPTIPFVVDTSSDDVPMASVDFFDGDALVGRVEHPPFQVEWAPTPGPHTLHAKATNAIGASASSPVISVVATRTSRSVVRAGYAAVAAMIGALAVWLESRRRGRKRRSR